MRFSLYLKIVVAIIAVIFLMSFIVKPEQSVESKFRSSIIIATDSLLSSIDQLYENCSSKNFNRDLAKTQLANCRVNYKMIEAFVTYYFPGEALILNRPVVPSLAEDDEVSTVVPFSGFQFIEFLLFNDSLPTSKKELRKICKESYLIVKGLESSFNEFSFDERSLWEASQLQLIRQSLLGLADFETPDSKNGRVETIASLTGISDLLLSCYVSDTNSEKTSSIIKLKFFISKANSYLLSHSFVNHFDFYTFYNSYYNNLSDQLLYCRDLFLDNQNLYQTTAVNLQVRSVFDPSAFNSYFFVPGKKTNSTKELIDLGRTLFFDPALSANNLRACASCHQSKKAFTDGLPVSQSFEPGRVLSRNAPTIINSVLQRKLFHDGRAFTFEDQAGRVMSNPLEMHNDFSAVAEKLVASEEYRKLFYSVFYPNEDTLISSRSILLAIAEYERSLIGMNSRFDKSISGRFDELSNDEKAGFNIFMGKAQCGSCHFLPLFNGLLPPNYVETEWESIGVPERSNSTIKKLDSDIGRYGIIPAEIFKHSFKTPTLRNIALTSPYMHNGAFNTLDEVIDFYDRGGGKALGYVVENQTLSDRPLNLSTKEKFQLKSFLESLTDTIGLTTIPTHLPTFTNNPNLIGRPIGGDY